MGERDAGHLNLKDFYRANDIQDEGLLAEVSACLSEGSNIMFNHDIRGKRALNYMWSVNGGTIYLIGYVPIEAIQQEGTTVNQNIFIVVAVMLTAFFLCCILYYFNQRQQIRIRKSGRRSGRSTTGSFQKRCRPPRPQAIPRLLFFRICPMISGRR